VAYGAVSAAGLWGALLLALLVASAAASFLPRTTRGSALLACGVAGFSAWLFAVGGAAARLMPPGDSSARVSIAFGAWLMFLGIVVVWFQGNRTSNVPGGRTLAAVVAVAVLAAAWFLGGLQQLSLVYEYKAQSDTFWTLTYNHILLSLGATAIAAAIGVPLGIAASRVPAVRATVIPAAGLVQTIPSLALYGLLVVPLGLLGLPTLGIVPALIALTLYALLPIVRNTFLGVSGVDAAIIDAGRGMGMSRGELLWRVELPLALPLVLEGIRTGLVMVVGITAVMAIIGAQTLGVLVFQGWGSTAVDLVLLGALPMVVLSIFADQGMRTLQRTIVSPGIRIREGQD
jgi:osmoprotectant transport system permease protein